VSQPAADLVVTGGNASRRLETFRVVLIVLHPRILMH